MSDPGLNFRLRQRSRRSGLMVGITMALTLLVCVGGFTLIFAQLQPYVSDFVTQADDPTATVAPVSVAQVQNTQAPTPSQEAASTEAPAAPTNPAATETPSSAPSATGSPRAFKPDYQIDSAQPVNLRTGPGVDSDIVEAVPVDAPLMYLNERKVTEDPSADNLAEGDYWYKVQTEDGQTGWIRAIDLTKYQP